MLAEPSVETTLTRGRDVDWPIVIEAPASMVAIVDLTASTTDTEAPMPTVPATPADPVMTQPSVESLAVTATPLASATVTAPVISASVVVVILSRATEPASEPSPDAAKPAATSTTFSVALALTSTAPPPPMVVWPVVVPEISAVVWPVRDRPAKPMLPASSPLAAAPAPTAVNA